MLHNLRTALAARKRTQVQWARKVGITTTRACLILYEQKPATAVVRRRTAKWLDADERWLFDSSPAAIPPRPQVTVELRQ